MSEDSDIARPKKKMVESLFMFMLLYKFTLILWAFY